MPPSSTSRRAGGTCTWPRSSCPGASRPATATSCPPSRAASPPGHAQLRHERERRRPVVPRYRQKLAHVPLGQARPEWVDDPHFNVRYHVRHSALPAPGGYGQPARLAGGLSALPPDRTKPLGEMTRGEGLAPAAGGTPRFAIISKTHHA